MDGAKHNTDTSDIPFKGIVVDRRLFCAEASSKEGVEREGMQILVSVRSDFPEIRKTS